MLLNGRTTRDEACFSMAEQTRDEACFSMAEQTRDEACFLLEEQTKDEHHSSTETHTEDECYSSTEELNIEEPWAYSSVLNSITCVIRCTSDVTDHTDEDIDAANCLILKSILNDGNYDISADFRFMVLLFG